MKGDGVAKNGSAIINGKVVRSGGMRVLRALFELGRPVIAPEVARYLGNKPSVQSIYTVLTRLEVTQQLVTHNETTVMVLGASLPRVVWELTHPAKTFFASLKKQAK